MLRVAAYTSGKHVPGARFRVRQYIPALQKLGIEVREYHARLGSYPPRTKALRPLWGLIAAGERALSTSASYFADITLLQREMLATLLTAEPLTRNPRVLDVDDAIFLHRGGAAARRLAKLCQVVICGNDFLAENFRQWNPNVRVLPTAVDTERYCPLPPLQSPVKRIGWSGESSNFHFLEDIVPALRVILDRWSEVVIRIVADRRPQLQGIPNDRVEFIRWTPENEVRAIQEMSIGLMPMRETLWARGKCSFKLLTYMACGLPAVASPVGMNVSVLAAGGGFGPTRWQDWVDALDSLLTHETLARRIGDQGRRAVVENYSLQRLAPRLAEILESCR
jgi:glycosyltransferase involved in cell wall biosynthesis